MAKCQVIFFNSAYKPDWLRRMELKDMQNKLRACSIEIYNECKGDRHLEILRVETLAQEFRSRWEIIDGEKEKDIKSA